MDESKRVTTTCPACSKQFRHWQSQPRKYCSPKCHHEDRTPGKWETVACGDCGKPVRSLKTWPRKYCSRKCFGKGQAKEYETQFQANRVTTSCQQCSKPFVVNPTQSRGLFCSRKCKGEWSSLHWRGETHWLTGRKTGRNKRFPPPTVLTCAVCTRDFVVPPSMKDKYFCCSKKCQGIRHSQIHSGENSPHWRGGVYEPYYGPSWKPARRAARARDKVCQDCSKTPEMIGTALSVHHIKRFSDFGVERHLEANDLTNLISLCPSCHTIRTRRGNPLPDGSRER